MNTERWTKYQQRTASGKPRPLLVEALSHVKEKEAALDIGAGALNDTQFLLSQEKSFREIVSIDITPQFKELTVPAGIQFSYIQGRLEDYRFPSNYFDLISAQYTLPFIPEDHFKEVWTNIHAALKENGIFTGQLFGERDDWFGKNGMTFHTKNEAEKLLNGFEIITFKEAEYTEESERKKHWHYFDLIIKKCI